MSLAHFHDILIAELSPKFVRWKFIKTRRSFERKEVAYIWFFHLTFINHASDFDVVADVAVEHFSKNERICIVGAELGNIQGIGQQRWTVDSSQIISSIASDIFKIFTSIGLPFLQRYSDLNEILKVLRKKPLEARLICPLVQDPQLEADLIENKIIKISDGN